MKSAIDHARLTHERTRLSEAKDPTVRYRARRREDAQAEMTISCGISPQQDTYRVKVAGSFTRTK